MRPFSNHPGACALAALVPAFVLGALVQLAPNAALTASVYPGLLVACGPLLPVSVVLSLIGLASPDRKRALVALFLFTPALACVMYGAHRAHMEGEARLHASPAVASPSPARP